MMRLRSHVFKHTRLCDPERQIRLLRIHPCECFGGEVELELSTHSLDTAPKYVAISYVWGDPEPQQRIFIDGKVMPVGPSCEHALQQTRWALREAEVNLYVWIDAVCVVQNDEWHAERSSQVQIMGQIYGCAEATFAALGSAVEHQDLLRCVLHGLEYDHPDFDGDHLRLFCRHSMSIPDEVEPLDDPVPKINSVLSEMCNAWGLGYDEAQVTEANMCKLAQMLRCCTDMQRNGVAGELNKVKEQYMRKMVIYRVSWNLNQQERKSLQLAYRQIMDKIYWTRLWVIQEVVVAKRVWLMVGEDIVDSRAVFHLDEAYVIPDHGPHKQRECWMGELRVQVYNESKASGAKRSLAKLLERFEHAKCSKRHDSVYGLLALAKWPPGCDRPTVDYQLALWKVAIDFARLLNDDMPVVAHGSEACRRLGILLTRLWKYEKEVDEEFESTVQRKIQQRSLHRQLPGSIETGVQPSRDDVIYVQSWRWATLVRNARGHMTSDFERGYLMENQRGIWSWSMDHGGRWIDLLQRSAGDQIQAELLYDRLGPAGCLCPGVQEGDIVAHIDIGLYMVLRPSPNLDHLEIVGQAILDEHMRHGVGFSPREDDVSSNSDTNNIQSPRCGAIMLRLNCEDLMVFVAQSFTADEHAGRLLTRVTSPNSSSYAFSFAKSSPRPSNDDEIPRLNLPYDIRCAFGRQDLAAESVRHMLETIASPVSLEYEAGETAWKRQVREG